MKKVATSLFSVFFAIQFISCPLKYVPKEWLDNYCYVKEVTALLVSLYKHPPAAEKKNRSVEYQPASSSQKIALTSMVSPVPQTVVVTIPDAAKLNSAIQRDLQKCKLKLDRHQAALDLDYKFEELRTLNQEIERMVNRPLRVVKIRIPSPPA